MADATYYVDFNAADDSGDGSALSPWKTWKRATGGLTGHSSGDTITIKTTPLAGGARLTMSSSPDNRINPDAGTNGCHFVIEPADGYDSIPIDGPYPLSGIQTGGSVTVRKIDWAAAANAGRLAYISNNASWDLTCEDCTFVIDATASLAGLVTFSPTNSGPCSITLRRCTITGWTVLVASAVNGVDDVTVEDCTVTFSDNYSPATHWFNSSPMASLTVTGSTFIEGSAAVGAGMLNTAGLAGLESLTVTDNLFLFPNKAPASALLSLADAGSGVSAALGVTFERNVVRWNATGDQAVRIGTITSAVTSREDIEAGLTGMLGTVSIQDNDIESANSLLLYVAIGVNHGTVAGNRLLATGGTNVHSFVLSGRFNTVRNNWCRTPGLGIAIFGDDNTLAGNVLHATGDAYGLLFGRNGSSTADPRARRNTIAGNVIISDRTDGDGVFTDYAYNNGESDPETNVLGDNRYVATAGAHVADLGDGGSGAVAETPATIAELVAAWSSLYGLSNDADSEFRSTLAGSQFLGGGWCSDGANDYAHTADLSALGTGDFGLHVWAGVAADAADDSCLASQDSADSSGWSLTVDSCGRATFSAAGISLVGTTNLRLGPGYNTHLISVLRISGAACLYVDGVLEDTDASATDDFASTDGLTLLADDPAGGVDSFCKARLFAALLNTAPTAGDPAALFAQGPYR